jgi:hypothetical protein
MDGSFVRSRLPVLTLALMARATWRSAGSRLRATARWLSLSALFGCSVMLGACGGGGSGDADATPPPSGGAVGGVTTPVVTTQPTSQAVALGSSITFTVTATGNGLAYQWQRSTTGGVSWQDIGGATSQSLTVSAIDVTMNGYQYHVIVGNVAGMVVSDAATLTVASAGGGGGTGGGSGGSGTGQHFLYAANNALTTINGFAFDPATGALTPTPSSPYPSIAAAMLTLHPNGSFLYATGAGGMEGTWVYRIDPTTGALSLVPGSPYAVGAWLATNAPPIIDPRGNYYVLMGPAGVSVFRIDSATGALTPVAGSPLVLLPTLGVSFDTSGRFMYFTDSGGYLQAVTLEPLAHVPGSPTTIRPGFNAPGGPVFPRGGYLFALLADRDFAAIAVDQTTGSLSISRRLQTNSTSDSMQLAAHPNGRCFFLNRSASVNTRAIQPITFDAASGQIAFATPLPLEVAYTLPTAGWLWFDPAGAYGYLTTAAYGLSGFLTPLEINGPSCSVAQNASGRFSTAGNSEPVVMDETGSFAFTTSYQPFGTAVAGVLVYRIDPVTRRPISVPGSPFATQDLPRSIVLR